MKDEFIYKALFRELVGTSFYLDEEDKVRPTRKEEAVMNDYWTPDLTEVATAILRDLKILADKISEAKP